MSIHSKDEYQLENGQYISIQCNENVWEVACWNKDDTAHWYLEFKDENAAKQEFERWKPK